MKLRFMVLALVVAALVFVVRYHAVSRQTVLPADGVAVEPLVDLVEVPVSPVEEVVVTNASFPEEDSSAQEAHNSEALVLWDPSVSLKVRMQTAWNLTRSGNPDDFCILTDYLSSSDVDLKIKALILESLGQSPHPGARQWLLSAVGADEEVLVRGALQGLATLDDPNDVSLFSNLLFSGETSQAVQAAAAEALGQLTSPEAGALLISAYRSVSPEDDAFRAALLYGLGLRDIAETESLFREILSRETDPDARLEVVEMVSNAKGDSAPFLQDCLRDEDRDVRAEAAWAMSMLDGDHGETLCDLLRDEEDAAVRQRIYEALGNEEKLDVPLILERSLEEESVEAKLAAYALVAANLNSIKDVEERESAQVVIRSEFESMALESETLNQRMRAVIGLRRMAGDDVEAALVRIAEQSKDPRVTRAAGIHRTSQTEQ